MKISNLRKLGGSVLSEIEMKNLVQGLNITLIRAGYLTHVTAVTVGGINIANGTTTFRVDTSLLGYNARFGMFLGNNTVVCKGAQASYTRTNLGTFQQKKHFNKLVNAVLDAKGYTADIRAGNNFAVRSRDTGAVKEWVWENDTQGVLVIPVMEAERILKEAREKPKTHLSIRPFDAPDCTFHRVNIKDYTAGSI